MQDPTIGMDQQTLTEVVRKFDFSETLIFQQWLPFKEVATEQTIYDIIRTQSGIAPFRAKDAEAELVEGEAIAQAVADMADIASKRRFNTSDLRKIREAGALPVLDDAPTLIAQAGREAEQKVRNALSNLRKRVDNRLEWLRVNALLGSISYSGRVQLSVDYGVPATQNDVTPAFFWDQTGDAKPLTDLITWIDQVESASGIPVRHLVTSRKVLLNLALNADFRSVLQYTNPLWSVQAAQDLVQRETGLTIHIYESKFTNKAANGTVTTSRFLDHRYIVLLPDPGLGGEVPEGSVGDVATAPHPLNNFQPGVYTWQDVSKDPYGLEVGVGILAFPRVFHPEALFNAQVLSI
jgi:hypothetical protein